MAATVQIPNSICSTAVVRCHRCDQQNGAASMIELVIVRVSLNIRMLPYGSINKRCLSDCCVEKSVERRCPCAGHFPRDLTAMDPLDAQAQYSELFDVAAPRHCCYLNMFTVNPVTGPGDGGPAGAVRAARFAVKQRELPDHLPLYLEYLSQLPQRKPWKV